MRAEAEEHQGYAGYDVFAADPRMPDFTNCTSHPERTHLHRQCHTKSIVRPALVELQHAHQVRPNPKTLNANLKTLTSQRNLQEPELS